MVKGVDQLEICYIAKSLLETSILNLQSTTASFQKAKSVLFQLIYTALIQGLWEKYSKAKNLSGKSRPTLQACLVSGASLQLYKNFQKTPHSKSIISKTSFDLDCVSWLKLCIYSFCLFSSLTQNIIRAKIYHFSYSLLFIILHQDQNY